MFPLVHGALYECKHVSVVLARNSEPRWRKAYVYVYAYAALLRDIHTQSQQCEYIFRHAHITYAILVHMYVCSHVPTRCSALGRSATQNSARPYYLRFVSWLQTITHFPSSSHLSPFSSLSLALRLSRSPSVCLFLFLFTSFPSSFAPFVLLLSFPHLFRPFSFLSLCSSLFVYDRASCAVA